MAEYKYEKDGQIDFYDKFYLDGKVRYENYTDGVINGCIFEFKLSISNINAVLFQTIKYLSRMRVLGKEIPAHIFLVNLNAEKAFYYKSQDFIQYKKKYMKVLVVKTMKILLQPFNHKNMIILITT